MENNKLIKTGIPNKKLRINAYGGLIPFVDQEPSTFTVQCAKITHMDSEVCGGMIHTVSNVHMKFLVILFLNIIFFRSTKC